jgi:hypothetical protein
MYTFVADTRPRNHGLRPLFGCSAFKFRTKSSTGGYLELGSHAARNRPNASAGPVFPRTGRSHPLCGPPIPGSSEDQNRSCSRKVLVQQPMVAAPAVRDDHRIRGYSAIDDEPHLSLVAAIDHGVGHSRNVTGPNPQQASRTPSVCVHDPVKIILYGVSEATASRSSPSNSALIMGAGIGRSSG